MGGAGSGRRPLDVVGRSFGTLVVSRQAEAKPVRWLSICDVCAAQWVLTLRELRRRKGKSCMCAEKKFLSQEAKTPRSGLPRSDAQRSPIASAALLDHLLGTSTPSWPARVSVATGVVYFIQPIEGGLVKIGFTTGLAIDRLASLQTGSPVRLRIIGTMRGTVLDEQRLHGLFAEEREHGEWFRPTERLLAWVTALSEAA